MRVQDRFLRDWERWGGRIPNYWKEFFFLFYQKIKDGKVGWQTVGDALRV
jgi:hypothetical protein